MMSIKTMTMLTEKIINNNEFHISLDEAQQLAALSDDLTIDLIACANRIRTKYKGNKVFTCGIVNAKSGFCSQDCAFCAQSSHHETGIETYPLLSREGLEQEGYNMYEHGATNYSMVTSGYSLSKKEMDTVCKAASTLKEYTKMNICASLGMLARETARQLIENGVSRYHHNLETSRNHFENICTTHDYEEDIDTIKFAKSTGLKVCSGGILGLGESWEQRVELAFTLRELDVDSISLNFLNPIPGTRLENSELLPPMEALKCIAFFRFINPGKDITICGGREVTLKDYQSWVFAAGANGLMVGNYLTSQGRSIETDMEMIKDMGIENEHR